MKNKKAENRCPLCGNKYGKFFCRDKTRDYFRCGVCDLIFVLPEEQLTPDIEKSRYDLHENNPKDIRYREFLGKMFVPIQEEMNRKRVPGTGHQVTGLDFGSGPGPTLSIMFEEVGFDMNIYDKFYCTDVSVFDRKYDFITATEVFEHLRDPLLEIERSIGCLKDDGVFGVMTKMTDGVDFVNWGYKNDDTHICFYSEKTFQWIGEKFGLSVEFVGCDVVLLRKNKVTHELE